MVSEPRIGEVIEAGTTAFVAECYELYGAPAFGSLVKTAEGPVEIYAVVAGATTASVEQGRRPIARGRDETSPEAVYRANPQLARLLRSEFTALVIGHRTAEGAWHYLPPRPARIHHFVYACSTAEASEFSRSFAFLSLLLGARLEVPVEELVAASLRQMAAAREDGRSFLVAAGKELAVLLNSDFNRLKAILARIRQ